MAAFDNLSNPSEYLAYWGKTYRNELLTNILPFWMKYGLDKENGGYFTCVDRDGSLMDSTNSTLSFVGFVSSKRMLNFPLYLRAIP